MGSKSKKHPSKIPKKKRRDLRRYPTTLRHQERMKKFADNVACFDRDAMSPTPEQEAAMVTAYRKSVNAASTSRNSSSCSYSLRNTSEDLQVSLTDDTVEDTDDDCDDGIRSDSESPQSQSGTEMPFCQQTCPYSDSDLSEYEALDDLNENVDLCELGGTVVGRRVADIVYLYTQLQKLNDHMVLYFYAT
ncbi:hypothetical protein B566_EDAN006203 [Ephemera danica]|nr:hypothetical protein B566_EDAN006203 [Ephemera danica]